MRTPRLALALALALAGACFSASSTAEAARVAPRGKVRVHLDTEVFAWSHSRAILEGLPPTRANSIGFGVVRPVTIDSSLGTSVLALGVGYGVHRHLIFGARFGMNFNSVAVGDRPNAGTFFTGTFTPYLEILPIPEGPVLPYIMLRTGVSGGLQIIHDETSSRRWDALSPIVGAGVGAHAFVTRYFSIDFGVTFDHRWHFSLQRTAPPGPVPPSWIYSSRGFTLAATLGLSTWF